MASIQREGRTITYDDFGSGQPALLLLHGWCASRRQLAPLLPHLRGRVLAVDLRGHGDSDLGIGDFGTQDLVDDTIAVIESAGARSIVPVAAAHAGWIALELCRRLGPRVERVVLLDWIVLDAPAPFLGACDALQAPATWEATRAHLFQMWTDGVDNQCVRDFVHGDMASHGFEMWARGGREIAAAYRSNAAPLHAFAELPAPPPVLHVYAQPRDDGYLDAQQAFAAAHPWFSVRRLASASSHFPYFEIPAEVADLVAGVDDQVAGRRSAG